MPTLTLQPSTKDTYLYYFAPDTNYGSSTAIEVYDRSASIIRGILTFDISELPANAILISAKLWLYYRAKAYTDPIGKTVWAYKLTRTDWVEAQATWNIYKTGNNWTAPGGDFVTSNPSGGSTIVPATFGWMSWNVLSIVQDALDNAITAEFLLKFETEGLESGYSSIAWYSKNYTTDPSLQPKLIIEYIIPPPEVAIRIAWDSDPFDDVPSWDDVSEDLIAYEFSRGRQHELDRFESGMATILLDNSHGYYWKDNEASPYSPNIDMGKRVNIQVAYGGVTYDRYTGYIESMKPKWLSDRGGIAPVMQIECADAMAIFSRARLNTSYEQELSDVRIENVLDSVGFPIDDREIDEGASTIIASILTNIQAQDHIYKVCESELGLFYMLGNGYACYEGRGHRAESPHDDYQATFNDSFAGIELAFDDRLLFNEIRATRQDGAEQKATNNNSIVAYGLRSLVRSGLLLITDTQVFQYAAFLLARHALPTFRARSLTLEPQSNPVTLFPYALGFEISTRIKVQKASGFIDGDYFIEGIAENYDARDDKWETKWQLSDAEHYLYDMGVETLRPDDAGDETNIAAPAPPHWDKVDDEIADGYATCVQTDDANYQRDLYNLPAHTGSGTINLVIVHARCVALYATPSQASLKIALKTGDTVYESDEKTLTNNWADYYNSWDTNPATGQPWGSDWAVIDALQIGVALRRCYTGVPAYGSVCTQVFVEIIYTIGW